MVQFIDKLFNNTENIYKSNIFSLRSTYTSHTIRLDLQCHTEIVNTRSLPKTTRMLKNYLPSVLQTTCFNNNNLPFHQEVEQTELGHLFEHILLDLLCIEKKSHGHSFACFSGRTTWDWISEPQGLFHVLIPIEYTEMHFLNSAIHKTIQLFEKIIT